MRVAMQIAWLVSTRFNEYDRFEFSARARLLLGIKIRESLSIRTQYSKQRTIISGSSSHPFCSR